MKVLTSQFLFFILAVLRLSKEPVKSQILSFNGNRYRKCEYSGLKLPFYPCIKSKINPKTKACKGQINSLADCLDCKERKNKLPYPMYIPPCNTECSPESIWCEPQQKCIHQDLTCDCGPDHTYCTYIDKDKIEHIGVKDVRVRGTTEKYRCLSSKDLESKKINHEFKICPDGSCKESFMNCSGSTDTSNSGSSGSAGLAVGLSLTFVVLLSIVGALAGVYFYKRKNDEIMWVDDNPEYGEVHEYDEATTVIDENDYYRRTVDNEEETAIIDLNAGYGRFSDRGGRRGKNVQNEGWRDSESYDEMSTYSKEDDYD